MAKRQEITGPDPEAVLSFWLEELSEADWYSGGEALDALCRSRFADACEAARSGRLSAWVEGPAAGPRPALAFLILTDQLPRNIHRGTAEAFAADPLARAATRRSLGAGWDLAVAGPERQFFYLPLEHSEDLADQDLAVQLFAERMPDAADNHLHARAHREIISRFGRFPFRNSALGRTTTAEEAAFLAEGGYGAVLRELQSGSHA